MAGENKGQNMHENEIPTAVKIFIHVFRYLTVQSSEHFTQMYE